MRVNERRALRGPEAHTDLHVFHVRSQHVTDGLPGGTLTVQIHLMISVSFISCPFSTVSHQIKSKMPK